MLRTPIGALRGSSPNSAKAKISFWKLDSHIRAPFLEVLKMGKFKGEEEECTLDVSVDLQGQPAIRERTGKWVAGIIIL
ncbi:unnamed protein product [Camellia sinensis]